MKYLILLVSALAFIIASCSKQRTVQPIESSVDEKLLYLFEQSNPTTELYNIMMSISKESLNREFRRQVYEGVSKRFDGDYNFLISELLEALEPRENEFDNLQAAVEASYKKYSNQLFPQIYIPYFELHKGNRSLNIEPIVFVVWDGIENKDDSYAGYVLDENGELVEMDHKITETYAKQNEVWCISFNERMGASELTSSINNKNIEHADRMLATRNDGGREMVERIRIPDYGEIEGWPAGDLELQLSAATAATKVFQGMINVDKDLLDEGQWTNLFKWLFYWYKDEHGIFLNMHWVEVDDGGSPGTRTFTIPAQNGFPGVSYSYPYSGNDEDLGEQLVQFPDPGYAIYGTGLIEWEMNSGPFLD